MSLSQTLEDALASITASLAAGGVAVDTAFVAPGATAAIDPSTCRTTLWIRLVRAFPSASIPQQEVSPRGGCPSQMAYQIEVGLVRCYVPQQVLNARVTDVSAIAASAAACADDVDLLADAMVNADLEDFILGAYTPLGPEGNMVGGVWTAHFRQA